MSEKKHVITLFPQRGKDDGSGLPGGSKNAGLGLHTMQYRAKMLGGFLEVAPASKHGTIFSCSFSGKELIHAKENIRT